MNAARRLTLLALALTLAAAAACSSDQATGPSPAASFVTVADRSGGEELTHDQLAAWELRERIRVAAEREASLAIEDALETSWDAFPSPGPQTRTNGPVVCQPLGYAADVQIVGPEGGELTIGPHSLSIPAGALESRVVITGEMPASKKVSVRLSPHGLRFARQPTLTLSYRHCALPAGRRVRVAYTDERLRPIEFPASRDYTDRGVVAAWLEHFSRYALWY